MMPLPPSSSEEKPSSAFHRFHPEVQRWIYEQGWTQLHEIQELAADPILSGDKDIILGAPTAGGKTEAAFLPICSLLRDNVQPSIQTLYVGPLKALINDQFQRLEILCERLDIPVCRWHGDVNAGKKKNVLKKPRGILLITPESLEALFILQGPAIPNLFKHISFIVIDELHAFIGSERGRQLQSLLHRVELALRRPVPRIGLSATLGDMRLAAEFLRPKGAQAVILLCSGEGGQEIKLRLRGYKKRAENQKLRLDQDTSEQDLNCETSGDKIAIAHDLMRTLRGSNNLIFANSRQSVEVYADYLRRMSEKERVPNEFFPHHGNLSKELREELEANLKEAKLPVSAVCTTTLELGIDIGTVKSIAQIGAPHTVGSMRQRLGRSGRRGEPAIMRLYIQEDPVTKFTPPQDALRMELVQAIAMVNLLIQKWYEPPGTETLHLSTLIQQVLSTLAQHGGAKATELWKALCQSGPFYTVTQTMFIDLLRNLGEKDLINQTGDGTIVFGLTGERLVNHYEFYAAFNVPEEYRLVAEGKTLGTIPLDQPILPGMYLIFSGRRWEVMSIEPQHKLIIVKSATGGRPPKFGGTSGLLHDRIRKEMLAIYKSRDVPPFLDATALTLLEEGRDNFLRYGLLDQMVVDFQGSTILFFWSGDRFVNTIAVQLAARGLKVFVNHGTISVDGTDPETVKEHIKGIIKGAPAVAESLASTVPNKLREKYDWVLSEDLLCKEFASKSLDTQGAWEALVLMAETL